MASEQIRSIVSALIHLRVSKVYFRGQERCDVQIQI